MAGRVAQELELQLQVARDVAEAGKREAARLGQASEVAEKDKAALEVDWGRRVDRLTADYEDKLRVGGA